MKSCRVNLDIHEIQQTGFLTIACDGLFTSFKIELKDIDRSQVAKLVKSESNCVRLGSVLIVLDDFNEVVHFHHDSTRATFQVPLQDCAEAFRKLVAWSSSIVTCVRVDTIGAEYDVKKKTLEFSWYVDGSREVQTKRFLLDIASYTPGNHDLSFQIKAKCRAEGEWEVIKFEAEVMTLTVKYAGVGLILDRDRVEHALNDLVIDCNPI